jgi:ech hydrogenase subunit C
MSALTKSPWILHYDASSCNGCDIEVLAALTPLFDVERFGIINTGNPKHADVLLITGSVNDRQVPIVQQLYEQMLEPKVVVACGICACTGGVFKECYNTLGGVDVAIPVDVYAPGCAVRPEAIIDAVVKGLGVLEERRVLLAAGKLVAPELPAPPSAADKWVEGESVAAAWRSTIAAAYEARASECAQAAGSDEVSGEQ